MVTLGGFVDETHSHGIERIAVQPDPHRGVQGILDHSSSPRGGPERFAATTQFHTSTFFGADLRTASGIF